MAQLYIKHAGEVTFRCYGERGIMSYFMFRELPTHLAGFLQGLSFTPNPSPFQDVLQEQLTNITIFSELGFGTKHGFGAPDGAVYFKVKDQPTFIMIEAKLHETYHQSCQGHAYNSTIKGQLELKWRLISLFKDGGIQTPEEIPYIVETPEMIEHYMGNDVYYRGDANAHQLDWTRRRRLRLQEGVAAVFYPYLDDTQRDRIFYLALTTDMHNPWNGLLPEPVPECWTVDGMVDAAARHQFCWANVNDILDI